MRFTIPSFVFALAATAKAYHVDSPSGGCVDISQPLNVTWTAELNATPPTVSFVLSNEQGAYLIVDRLYENHVVDGTQLHTTLPGLDTAEALNYSQNNGGKGYSIWMVPPNSPKPHNSNHFAASDQPFRIVAPGASTNC